jgi:hypothetical protein
VLALIELCGETAAGDCTGEMGEGSLLCGGDFCAGKLGKRTGKIGSPRWMWTRSAFAEIIRSDQVIGAS